MADEPIKYIERTRAYYNALGYDNPYEWARFDDVPFTPLSKPLSDCRVGLVTTAAPFQPGKGDQDPGAPYNADAKFYQVYSAQTDPMPDLRISHVAIDRDHTTAKDMGTYFPLSALNRAKNRGLIGAISPNFYGLPTNRSQATTLQTDCPDLVHGCRLDALDVAILVPNCPVCHQSVSLAARALEADGIATVILGCALDIVENVGVPRFVFSDFPLGNSAGLPGDAPSQDQTLRLALDVLTSASQPRATVRSKQVWPGAPDWKKDYSNPDNLSPEELAFRRAKFDAGKAVAKAKRDQI